MEIDIKKAIEIEKIHRYVFDNIYVQNKPVVNDVDTILEKYNRLVASYPNFRKDLYKFDKKKYVRYK